MEDWRDSFRNAHCVGSPTSSLRSLHLSDVSDVEDGITSTSTTIRSSDASSSYDTTGISSDDLQPYPLRKFADSEIHVSVDTKKTQRRIMEMKKTRKKYGRCLQDLEPDLEKEKLLLTAMWKEEFEAEQRANLWHNQIRHLFAEGGRTLGKYLKSFWVDTEVFIGNLPLTVGAVALSWVMMGAVWFKFAEETLSSCHPVEYWSSSCTFRELPGCFNCEGGNNSYYIIVRGFRYGCNSFAAVLMFGIIAKFVFAWKIVQDDLSYPTTSTPFGLLATATNMVASGHGLVGETLVMAASLANVFLFFWFLSMAYKYRMLPDPSWFPNTVCGLCCAATKIWPHCPVLSFGLLAVGIATFALCYPVSLLRVFLNRKISANVCWIQVSAPSIILYAMTLMLQPTKTQGHLLEHGPEKLDRFQELHGEALMPVFHVLFGLCLTGAVSSIHGLVTRWDSFRKTEFSPAHAAFCFPILSHGNAIQAYRHVIDTLADIPEGSKFKVALFSYWVFVLIGGSLTTLIITTKYLYHLPKWTRPDTTFEQEPPAPDHTIISDVLCTGNAIRQPFVSPTVLQANETGVLVRVRRDSEDNRGSYVRTLQVKSLGFEPTLDPSALMQEQEELLQWVATHEPRPRHSRTMSTPDGYFKIMSGLYGTFEFDGRQSVGHKRCQTQC